MLVGWVAVAAGGGALDGHAGGERAGGREQ
jgi:hypothetical protein